MRNWLPILFLLALPLAAQPASQRQVDSLSAKLARTQAILDTTQANLDTAQARLDSLVRTNNPIDLGNKILQAYKDGATHGENTMKLVGWVLAVVGGIVAALGTFGVFQILRIEKVTKYTKERMAEIRKTTNSAVTNLKKEFKNIGQLFEEKAEAIDSCEKEAREHLDSIKGVGKEIENLRNKLGVETQQRLEEFSKLYKELEKRTKKLDEVESKVESVEFKLKPAFISGLIAWEDKKYEVTLKHFDKAIKLKPGYVEVYDYKAAVLLEWGAELKGEDAKKKFKQAKLSAQKAIELSDGKIGHYNLACAQARLGELDEALESLKKDKAANEAQGEKFDSTHAWKDDDLEPLRKGKWRKRFIEIVGPPPEGMEKPKPKSKRKTTKKKR